MYVYKKSNSNEFRRAVEKNEEGVVTSMSSLGVGVTCVDGFEVQLARTTLRLKVEDPVPVSQKSKPKDAVDATPKKKQRVANPPISCGGSFQHSSY